MEKSEVALALFAGDGDLGLPGDWVIGSVRGLFGRSFGRVQPLEATLHGMNAGVAVTALTTLQDDTRRGKKVGGLKGVGALSAERGKLSVRRADGGEAVAFTSE